MHTPTQHYTTPHSITLTNKSLLGIQCPCHQQSHKITLTTIAIYQYEENLNKNTTFAQQLPPVDTPKHTYITQYM